MVLNGSSVSGQASDAESLLSGLGYHTVGAGNADASTYHRTQVIVNTAASGPGDYTARRLQRLLNADLVHRSVPGQSARIVVIIGSQYP
jgi:hypothetical protein